MEEGTRTKKTVFVGGISDEVDETVLVETFAVFGEHAFINFRMRSDQWSSLKVI